MKIDWIEWLGRGMQLALVVLVVGGLYQWSAGEGAKQDAMCDVALSYAEVLDSQGGATRQEIKRAEKVADEACAEPEYNDY